MAPFKIEFATVRELEKKTHRVFLYGGMTLAAGLVLTLVGLLYLGLPLMGVAIVIVMGGIAWISMLGKEPSRQIFCPYCSSKNDVFRSRREFDCDICNRPVGIDDVGMPIMLEAIDTEARYDRPSIF